MTKVKRILLGTVEICRNLHDLAEAFRQLGYSVDTVIEFRNSQHPDLEYSFPLELELFQDWVYRIKNPFVRYPRGLIHRVHKWLRLQYLLTAYDVYVFQFGRSLLPDNQDFPILKRRGKRIISIFQGSDIRHWSAADAVRRAHGLEAYSSYRDIGKSLNEALGTIRRAEKYSDFIYAQPSYNELGLRPYHHLFLAVNLSLYRHFIPNRDVPVVVHAPSRRATKGTEQILSTLDQLRSEGVKFELRLLEKMTNKEVIESLIEADVVVDELKEANYGMLALEGLATGCAVAGGNCPELVPYPPDRPILHIQPNTVYAQLRKLLTDKGLRVRLAQAGRPYVQKYHDMTNVAQEMIDRLNRSRLDCFEYHPTFFARDYIPPASEPISTEVLKLNAENAVRWGLPEGVDPEDLVRRGLMAPLTQRQKQQIRYWDPEDGKDRMELVNPESEPVYTQRNLGVTLP